MSTISAGVTVPTALNLSGDTTGALTFQVSGTVTAATISAAGNFGIGVVPGAWDTGNSVKALQVTNAAALWNYSTSNIYLSQNILWNGTNRVYTVTGSNVAEFSMQNGTFLFHNATSGTVGGTVSLTERMRIDTSGNVGIGVTPTANLDVKNAGGNCTISAQYGTGTKGQLIAASNEVQLKAFNGTNDVLTFATGASERMRINSSGNVGIGTASPSGNLQVSGANPRIRFSNTAGTASTLLFGADSGVVWLGAETNAPMYFITNNTERMRLTSGGDISVGRAASSSVRFFIQGADTGSSNYTLALYNSAEQNIFYVRNDGAFSTGTASLSPYNLTTGNAANVYLDAAGVLNRSTSSLRYKTNVVDATHGLADVLKLRSVTYRGKNDGDKTFGGLIAEEVHDAGLTEFVAYDNEGRPDALHYGNMVALAFKAIQELKAENDALKARIEALETK